MGRSLIHILVLCLASLFTTAASANIVTEYTNNSVWQQAAGSYTTIDFTGLQQFQLVSTQYSHLGVTFTDGDNASWGPFPTVFPQDDWGLRGGANEHIMVELSSPAYVFAAHHPGNIRFQLFWNNKPIYTSSVLGGDGANFFSGLVSSIPFNGVRIWDPYDHLVYVDNIYVNVPGPGALSVFALAVMFGGSRRRRS